MENVVTTIGSARFKSKTNNGEPSNYLITVSHITENPEFAVFIRKRILAKSVNAYKACIEQGFKCVRSCRFQGNFIYLMEQTMGIRKQSFDVINTCVEQIVRTHRNSLNQIHSN